MSLATRNARMRKDVSYDITCISGLNTRKQHPPPHTHKQTHIHFNVSIFFLKLSMKHIFTLYIYLSNLLVIFENSTLYISFLMDVTFFMCQLKTFFLKSWWDLNAEPIEFGYFKR